MNTSYTPVHQENPLIDVQHSVAVPLPNFLNLRHYIGHTCFTEGRGEEGRMKGHQGPDLLYTWYTGVHRSYSAAEFLITLLPRP